MKSLCTFETKCWENDYELMLKTQHLERMINNCNYTFAKKQLIINNVKDEPKVYNMARALVNCGTIQDVFLASEYAEEALSEYDVQDKFERGYNYSIAELVGILKCSTKYLLHFSSDSYIPKKYSSSNWIQEAINLMEENSNIVVANPTWNMNYQEAKKESINILGNFYLGYGFSDQCYLINTDHFKKAIYNYKHPDSERYPQYGGELFEKKVDSFMRVTSKFRLTAIDTSYISKNVTKSQILLEKIGLKKI